jgi:hypothetical protein
MDAAPCVRSQHRTGECMNLSREDEERIVESQRRTNAEQIAKGAREDLYLAKPKGASGRGRVVGAAARGETSASGEPVANPLARVFTREPRATGAPKILIRSAAAVAATVSRTQWLLRPYLERDAVGMLYGDYGTMKSFIVLDWSLRVALGMPALGFGWPAQKAQVLLVSAEGRSMPHRLRAWCLLNFPHLPFSQVLGESALHCIEHSINLSDVACARALVDRVNDLKLVPQLVVLDTMTKNSDGLVEQSTADAGAYLAVVDHVLRGEYRCGVLLTHHVGHAEKDRIRGPIILAANTDTLIQVANPGRVELAATLTVERQKDSTPPPPQMLRARIVPLGIVDADGEPVSSLAIENSEALGAPKVAAPRGKEQQRLLTVVQALPDANRGRSLAELREVGRRAGMHRNSARSAAAALVSSAFMESADGGFRPASLMRTNK